MKHSKTLPKLSGPLVKIKKIFQRVIFVGQLSLDLPQALIFVRIKKNIDFFSFRNGGPVNNIDTDQ